MSTLWSFLAAPAARSLTANAPVVLIPLPGEAVLAVSGPDSQKFLQGQTTTDFREVTADTSRAGACCNLKGRATVSYRAVLWRDTVHLVMDAALREATRATLQKYIIFSKAQLATPDMAVLGLLGDGAPAFLRQHFNGCPETTDGVMDAGDAVLVKLPGTNRFLVLVSAEHLPVVWSRLSDEAVIGGESDWRVAQIRAGETQVTAATAELFQPQELNLQALNGISYNKGCYTGQEIVARLYFRGKLKSWVHRFTVTADTVPPPGSPVINTAGQTAGHVVLAAPDGAGRVELLAVTRHDAVEGLHLAESTEPLQPAPLPYTVEVKE